MYEIIDRIKSYNYKKLIFPVILISMYILGFVYLNDKINKKEITKVENIIYEENIKEEEVINDEEILSVSYIYIDVKGAVKKPGVYKLVSGSRVIDAINISGGLVKNSNTNYLNLSKVLKDSDIVKIYTNEEIDNMSKEEIDVMDTSDSKVEEEIEKEETLGLININTAPISELDKLEGIGEAKASAIVEYREKNGLFKSIDDIKNVSGISESLFEKIKDFITV
jgi:competence protein ComEA